MFYPYPADTTFTYAVAHFYDKPNHSLPCCGIDQEFWHLRADVKFSVNPGTGYKLAHYNIPLPETLHQISVASGCITVAPPIPSMSPSRIYPALIACALYVEYQNSDSHDLVLFDTTLRAYSEPHQIQLDPVSIDCVPLDAHIRFLGLDVIYGGTFDKVANPASAVLSISGCWRTISVVREAH